MDNDDIQQTPRSSIRDIGIPRTPQMTLMDEFEDSDNEDEDLLTSLNSSYTLLDLSSSGVQEFSLLLDSSAADSDKQEADTQSGDVHSPPLAVEVASSQPVKEGRKEAVSTSPKLRIEVQDVAYTTYRSMLYYVSWDSEKLECA